MLERETFTAEELRELVAVSATTPRGAQSNLEEDRQAIRTILASRLPTVISLSNAR